MKSVFPVFIFFLFQVYSFPIVAFADFYSDEKEKSDFSESVVNGLVAVINGEPLTLLELRDFAVSEGIDLKKLMQDKDLSELSSVVKSFVFNKVLLLEAKKMGIEVSEGEIDQYIMDVAAQNALSVEGLEKTISSSGKTWLQYKDFLHREILRTKVVSASVRNKVAILEEDVDLYLKEHPGLLPTGTTIELESVAIPILEKKSRQFYRRTMNNFRKRAIEGEELSSIAPANYLHMGFIQPDDLKNEIAKGIHGLNAGGISKLIENDKQIAFFKVKNIVSPSVRKEQIRSKIRGELFQREFARKSQKFIAEELSEQYDIEIKLGNVK